MGTGARLLMWLVATVAVFIGLANLAVLWHGALFIVLMAPYAWAVNKGLGWARS